MSGQLTREVALAPFTSFQVGGPAEWFLQPDCDLTMTDTLAWVRQEGLPVTVLGLGTNMLISDHGVRGLVLHLKTWRGVRVLEEGIIEVRAGEPIARLSLQMARRGWAGLEWSIGVPGSVGGAVVMNAGAHGSQMADTLESVEVLTETGERRFLDAGELGLGYRSSALQNRGWVVLNARIRLLPGGDAGQLVEKIEGYSSHRRRTQPTGFPNCGSVFRNPTKQSNIELPSYAAGWLLEHCNLKGLRVGAAQVAEQHANFILNRGGATARDILSLMRQMRDRVYQQWGVLLEPEVRILGEDSAC
ncbi:MAG: UDP-N-acetylmuramate dehydrogenase [Gemmatimonadaceae bacterium]|nr:UDP-N-acetylmuramate dehydrogenase [Gloeobacterales cyanobacterium ES-bin-141]